MSSLAYVPLAVAAAGAWLLVYAGTSHLTGRKELARTLARQGFPGRRRRAVLAAGLGPFEAGLGLAVTAGLLDILPGHRPVLGLEAATFAGFATYGALLLRRRPGVDCGCGPGASPVSGVVVARAAALSGASALAGALLQPGTWSVAHRGAALATGAVLALLLWCLPAAVAAAGDGRAGGATEEGGTS